MRTNFVNGSSSKTVLRPDFDTCSIQTHVPTHIMKLQIPKSDCTEVTIQNPFLTEDEIGHSRIGRSEDNVSSAF